MQVGSINSGERGVLTIAVKCMSATGQHLKKRETNGTKFYCNPSGYMTSEIFHCSNKLQSLDVAFMGPFKSYSRTSEDFMRRFPGRVIGLYDVSEITNDAVLQAASATVAISGFRKTGIWSYNREIFNDDQGWEKI